MLSWVDNFTLTDEEADMISDPKWVYENLIIQGHLSVFPAPPNGGKTAVFMHIAGEIAEQYQVFYVNADISAADAKSMLSIAKSKGFKLLLPDMKAGLSMDDVITYLEAMNKENADYSNYIFIFDTLKKMTDVINKSNSKKLYKTLRGLSAKGMTIILLAHTNKYADKEGKPIYEGTGDLRADVDELIYLTSKKNTDGSMTISTEPDKVRGIFEAITFEISSDRKVSLSDNFIDIVKTSKQQKQRHKDKQAILVIIEAMKNGKRIQKEITSYCNELGLGINVTRKILERYSNHPQKLWTRERTPKHNTLKYSLNDQTP